MKTKLLKAAVITATTTCQFCGQDAFERSDDRIECLHCDHVYNKVISAAKKEIRKIRRSQTNAYNMLQYLVSTPDAKRPMFSAKLLGNKITFVGDGVFTSKKVTVVVYLNRYLPNKGVKTPALKPYFPKAPVAI